MWYLIKFNEDNTANLINEAYIDGYRFGDRFLEGCPFKVSLVDGGKDFKVEAEPDVVSYLNGKFSDHTKWEAKIYKRISRDGDDMLNEAPGFGGDEVHLTDNLEFYRQDGLTILDEVSK